MFNTKNKLMNTIIDTKNSQHLMTAYTSSQNNLTYLDNNNTALAQTIRHTPLKVKNLNFGPTNK